MPGFDPHNSVEFLRRDPQDFAMKLGIIAMDGPESVTRVFDFDCTLSTNSREDGVLPTTWDVMHAALDAEDKVADSALATEFAYLEHQPGGLTPEMALDWWESSLTLHLGKTNISTIRALARSSIKLRAGALEALDIGNESRMTSSIVSAGISEVIKFAISAAMGENGDNPTIEEIRAELDEEGKYPQIISNGLEIDDDGTIIGWRPAEMITSRNKLKMAHERLALVRKLRPHTILVGDSIEDAAVVVDPPPEEKGVVLRFRVSDCTPRASTALTPAYANASYKAGYDAIIGESLEPLVEVTDWIIDQAPRAGGNSKHTLPAQRRATLSTTAKLTD